MRPDQTPRLTQADIDVPRGEWSGKPITDAKLTGTKLMFGITALGAKYAGELAGSKLPGECIQPGMPAPAPRALTRQN